jgi:glutaredoxin 2
MSLTLYHYVHCPFCVRVRMALGYLKVEYKSKVVPYDDELTPVKLTGKKMLPILAHETGAMNESLDIIKFIDKKNVLKVDEYVTSHSFKELEALLAKIGSAVHSLAMPYWIYTPEFTESSRQYFQLKKEQKRGPFSELVRNQKIFIGELMPYLNQIEMDLIPFYQSPAITIEDILIASHIWGLYVVPEFQFSEKMHIYLQSIKQICNFNYHQDFWSPA